MWETLKERGDRKCYFSYNRCRGFKRRRNLITIDKGHCRENGQVEGGHEYSPMVSYSLYVFIILIVFVNICMLIVEQKECILLFLWIYSIE